MAVENRKPVAPTAPGDGTRDRIISAAERLFAEHGLDGVSLRAINRASGARNAVAIQYHFEDKAGLVAAVLAKHIPDVDARRHELLDLYESNGAAELRSLAAALVLPAAEKLADPDGGPEYLQIYAEIVNRPRQSEAPESSDSRDSIQRWRVLVQPFLGEDATRLHRRFTAIRFAAAELGRRATSGPHTDDRLFVSHLVDIVTSLLVAPTSAETLALADARDAARNSRRR